jgi:serine/threonine-protein kinase HipA
MKLAQSLELPVAEIELCALDGSPADNPEQSFVVIKRYDRVQNDTGNIRRLHQEDFCQALGYGYEKKYQFDGGPAFSDCLNLIKEKSSEPATDLELLLKWQIFNLLAGNSDGHAKNISLLYSEENSLRLAPFYDLVCTRAIEKIDTKLAFAIGEQYDPGQINQNDWSAFATENDINQRFLFNLVIEQAEQIQDALPSVIQKFKDDYGGYEALQRVEQVINNQCKRTLKSLI